MKRTANQNDYKDYDDNPKRKFTENNGGEVAKQSNEASDRVGEYVRDLIAEKEELKQNKLNNAVRLLDQEISKVQSTGRIPTREYAYVNICREKPVKVTTKVLVPVKEHPTFNFVGKLLGPKGEFLKRLQEETMCKMSILGKGCMKDPQKEEELKESGDPKYAHLEEELHIAITAFGPPAEAHARMAYALAEVRKYLIPDRNDPIRQEQLRELEAMAGSGNGAPRGNFRNPGMMKPGPRGPMPGPPQLMRTATRAPVMTPRVMPPKVKILSILDRARVAMEESYTYDEPAPRHHGYGGYDGPPSPSCRYEESGFAEPNYSRKGSDPSYGDPSSQRWKPSPSAMPPRHAERSRYRPASYSRR